MAPATVSVAVDNSWKSAVKKEERTRWCHEANAGLRQRASQLRMAGALAVPGTPTSMSTTLSGASEKHRSSAVGFLEEKTGASSFEYGRSGTKELLYHGTSADGHGRIEYLQRRKKYGVSERYGHAMTETQSFGMGCDAALHGPKHGHKAVIEHSFFRKNGAAI
mmetsp:Transcript_104152/g.184973  ORF Transcript_104152/g.184973 Transcript_104152/m.184973 type:complete len:164 (-) Transcript_104152:56-547(-)|eukprot:CAMPEP_0197708898 /NCGR_PEP_ID=MMETSP1338-20131121/128185_1 /TAXON_ID=43686 ORGANISM="Pelagodinium beii, Strain RCC1491" /NCGR_SAMPLE_ID=MMETSP1338 /ASSEMBLY_ACC=CAM_ASM_000754 /LENGTH=163 /DNA_ID=CAMNT_0043292829 /DNA_START=24 /DNA_END=515 /DNA_ORIENTATION=+